MENKRQKLRDKRRRQRQLRRVLHAWIARILVFGTPVLVFFLAAAVIFRFSAGDSGAEDAGFPGAAVLSSWNTDDRLTVAVDAGHGGRDQGTSAGGILEKDVNLDVAERVAEALKNGGVRVVMTRSSDIYMDLEDRAELANQEGADLFVSIHCNYCEDDTSVQGMECYYSEDSEEGEALAGQILSQAATLESVVDRGVRSAGYRVLLRTEMPAVLVELGYFSNASERGRLTDPDYQQQLAEKIAEGILTSSSTGHTAS